MPEKNSTTKIQFIDSLFGTLVPFLAFLVPVFFLPLTLEFYEFNKFNLILLSVIVMLIAWVAKMIILRQVSIVKSKLDLAIGLVVISFALSTLFSLNKVSSIYGSQGRWFPSLLGIATFVALYYSISSNITSAKTIKNTLYAFVTGVTISSAVMLLRYFGLSFGSAAYLQVGNFNLSGSTITATSLAALGTLISLGLIVRTSAVVNKVFLVQAAVLNIVLIILVGAIPSIAALIIGGLVYLYFTPINLIALNKSFFSIILGALLVIIGLLAVPQTRQVIVNQDYPRDVVLSPTESWRVATSTLRDFPLLGTGPSTFYLNYPRYRSVNQNAGALWNVRFDRAYNEVFNMVGTLGLFGIVAMTLFAIKTGKLSLSKESRQEETGLSGILSIATIATLVVLLFSSATISIIFVLFLMVGLNVVALHTQAVHAEKVLLSLSSIKQSMSLVGPLGVSYKKETLQYFISLPIIALAAWIGLSGYKNLTAEYYMRRALTAIAANDGNNTYRYQALAIKTHPKRDSYRNSLARTNIVLSNSIASKKELSDNDKETIRQLVTQAIQETRVTTEVLNPLNVANWETRAYVYSSIAGLAKDGNDWAARAYTNAIQIDPTNPALRLALGSVAYAKQDYLSAANQFRQAAALKSDYANAHYNFAQALIQLKSYADAKRELEIVQRLLPADSKDREKLVADIKKVDELLQAATVAGAADERPTVDQLQTTNTTPEQTPQEPLTKPNETVPVIENNSQNNVEISEQGTVGENNEQTEDQNN